MLKNHSLYLMNHPGVVQVMNKNSYVKHIDTLKFQKFFWLIMQFTGNRVFCCKGLYSITLVYLYLTIFSFPLTVTIFSSLFLKRSTVFNANINFQISYFLGFWVMFSWISTKLVCTECFSEFQSIADGVHNTYVNISLRLLVVSTYIVGNDSRSCTLSMSES